MHRIDAVDRHPVLLAGLASTLAGDPGIRLGEQYESGEQALRALKEELPDLLIAGLTLGDIDGLELLRRIREQHPQLAVLVFSMHEESLYAERVLAAGGRGYVMKTAPVSEVLEAVRCVLRGEIYLSESMTRRLLKGYAGGSASPTHDALGRLTDRELEVLRGIGEGRSTRDLAAGLGLSIKTIESYRANLKLKLNLDDGSELVRYAVHWIARGGQV